MKKVILAMGVLSLAFLVSCGNNGTEESLNADPTKGSRSTDGAANGTAAQQVCKCDPANCPKGCCTDANGDGVCDKAGTCGNNCGKNGNGTGTCNGFVDNNGDGVCDNAGTGCGKGKGNGNGRKGNRS